MSEAQTIYRSFLKVIQKWPVDKVRPNRDLKQILATRVEESFRNEQTLNVQDAKKQLIALEKLLNNDFKARNPLSEKIMSPASNPNYYSSLMSSLNSNSNSNKSVFAKIFGR